MASPEIVPPPENRLFLVDGYAIIYRAFFAMIARPLKTSRGENTSAAWGVANFLQRLLAKHQPAYLGWVHDSGLSFRHERYPEYKATREKLSEELQADFDRGVERIEEMLGGYRVPILKEDGYEADDVIGTLAAAGAAKGLNVVIVSGDKDFHQLIGPRVWLLNPGRGGPAAVDEQWIGPANETERLGVSAARVTDYLGLVGDSSDNVPGVRGIGEKTALALIQEYGSLEEILAHAGAIRQKRAREALLEQQDGARLSKELVTIRTDVPIELDLEALRVFPPNIGQLQRLFTELEFHSLVKTLNATLEGISEPVKSPIIFEANYKTVQSLAEVEELTDRIRSTGHMTVDTETVLEPGAPGVVDPLRSILVGLTVGLGPGQAYYLPFRHRLDVHVSAEPLLSQTSTLTEVPSPNESRTPLGNLPLLTSPEMTTLREVLEDPAVSKTAQNGKYDLLVLQNEGIELRPILFDTMIASYVLDPGRRSHGLDTLAMEFLGYQMMTYEAVCGRGKNAIGFDEVPIDVATRYSCEDADVTGRLAVLFMEQLEKLNLRRLFAEIEMPLLPVLAEMEAIGIRIDLKAFERMRFELSKERTRVENRIYQSAGEEFNINSNVQLRRILFEKVQLPVVKKSASGPSTDAVVLERLSEEGHELPALILEYRELAKLQSTYIEALPGLVNPHTGRLHTSFNQTVAATGRLSSSDPNLQNIPVRRELGREIRRAFIPKQDWAMMSADYSQIELRLLAHLSGDPAFLRTFREGGDIHRETAALIFGVSPDAVTSEMRSRAKTINFATLYGQGAHALSQQLRIPHGEAKAFIEQYFARFVGVREYLDRAVASAREEGFAETIFGRRRYIPELRDRNFNIRAFGERTAQNTPIQGSAADLIKIAMIRVSERLKEGQFRSAMLLQVHDELVFEAPTDELSEVTEMVRREMESAAELQVPLVVEVGIGPNWLESKH